MGRRIPQTPPGGRQLAKIPLLVIDLPASADAFAKGIINPLDGAFGVPVADIGPHGIVALVEGLDAIEVAVALPHLSLIHIWMRRRLPASELRRSSSIPEACATWMQI